MSHHVRLVGPDELRVAHVLFAAALHQDPYDDEAWERRRHSYPPGRTLGVSDASGLVGTAMSYPARTAVPGGALPTAAVSRVGVRADRTRRGVLSALMRAQFDDAAARGEVIATLRASEASIYGRFGYGVATRSREVTVEARSGLRADAPRSGTVRLLPVDDVLATTRAVHERIALHRPGGMTRHEQLWDQGTGQRIRRHEHLVAAVHTGPDGDDGYAVAVPAGDDRGFADRSLRVTDLHAAGVGATAGLWRFLLGLDLVGRVEGWMRPVDEPLELLLADPRDCRTTGIADETWLRILDVPAALAARSWGDGPPVRLAVHDRLRPQNDGVHPIGGAADGPPDLECDVAGLAMAYLGDRAPSELVATGWWRVHEPAAVACADALFATGTVPWCGTFF